MKNNELDYFEKKYENIIRSIPSVTVAVRVKPYIKILVEEEAKKRGFKISQYLNKIILKELRSPSIEEDQNYEIDESGTISNDNPDGKLPNNQDVELKRLNENGDMFSIEGLDMRDVVMKLSIRVEQLKEITSEFDQKMVNHFKFLEASRKAELRAKEIQKLINNNDNPPA